MNIQEAVDFTEERKHEIVFNKNTHPGHTPQQLITAAMFHRESKSIADGIVLIQAVKNYIKVYPIPGMSYYDSNFNHGADREI